MKFCRSFRIILALEELRRDIPKFYPGRIEGIEMERKALPAPIGSRDLPVTTPDHVCLFGLGDNRAAIRAAVDRLLACPFFVRALRPFELLKLKAPARSAVRTIHKALHLRVGFQPALPDRPLLKDGRRSTHRFAVRRVGLLPLHRQRGGRGLLARPGGEFILLVEEDVLDRAAREVARRIRADDPHVDSACKVEVEPSCCSRRSAGEARDTPGSSAGSGDR